VQTPSNVNKLRKITSDNTVTIAAPTIPTAQHATSAPMTTSNSSTKGAANHPPETRNTSTYNEQRDNNFIFVDQARNNDQASNIQALESDPATLMVNP